MSIEHTNYDNREMNLQNPPHEYKEYLNSLRCCICGSMEKNATAWRINGIRKDFNIYFFCFYSYFHNN